MKLDSFRFGLAAGLISFGCLVSVLAQTPGAPPPPPADGDFGPPDGGPGFDGPPPGGPGDFGPGGPGPGGFGPGGFGPGGGGPGGLHQKTELVRQFDRDGNGWLNAAERQAARASLAQQGGGRRPGGPGGRRGGFGGGNDRQESPQPGARVALADVKSYPGVPLYASNVLRTFFLEFEAADWEKELTAFYRTDVEVPAKLTVDGKSYPDVGVHFRGNTSFFMVGEGRKRSLNLSLDFLHDQQQLGGYRTLNLLNSHEDPSFLRTVLCYQVSRDYIPAPKANFVRLVINGEDWGVYVNAQQFNKDFTQENFPGKKLARWKVPGSPNGRGSLNYLGEDPAAYKRIYEIKTKDDPKVWADLIKLCRVLQETPAEQLEAALAPLLDVDGTLKFLALDNALANNDGFWTRASDYDLCQDAQGRFHFIPCDANETFGPSGGPGFGGGPGGRGGPGGFGPGGMLAAQILAQADRNQDQKLTQAEFTALAGAWFEKLDSAKTGKVSEEQFSAKLGEILPLPQGRQGFGPRGGGGGGGGGRPGGGRGGFGPAAFLGSALFGVLDANKDGSLTGAELKEVLAKWFRQWDTAKADALDEDQLRTGLAGVLPRPDAMGPGGAQGGRGGNRRGPGGPGGGGPGRGGAELDPLIGANDTDKPLLSKLLAVPALRTRYLGYVRDIAEKWLDWKQLGPVVQQYTTLIADHVKTDTRKLCTFEEFQKSLGLDATPAATGSPQGSSLRSFAQQRRTYLLNYPAIKQVAR